MSSRYYYQHTQPAILLRWIFSITIILTAIPLPATGLLGWIGFTIGLEILVLYAFYSLTVVVDSRALWFWFGPGFWRKRFLLAEIESVREVKNSWLHGWGIRYFIVLGGTRGWLYNVSGFDAVEFKMKNGKYYRIGTNDPSGLAQAVRSESTHKNNQQANLSFDDFPYSRQRISVLY